MSKIVERLKSFIVDINYIMDFVNDNFGTENILGRKNSLAIPARNYEIKNSRIKGYAFHGYGCLFQFKNHFIDIEFEQNRLGFKSHSFLRYLENDDTGQTIESIIAFLNEQVKNGILEMGNAIYFTKDSGPHSRKYVTT